MSTKSKNPHGRFFGLLNQMKGADKDSLVWQYSDMLTTSLPELLEKHPAKYWKMINEMQKIVDASVPADSPQSYLIERELKKRRSAILKRLQKYGIDTTDWNVVNRFMCNKRIAGKTLGEMDCEEMDLLIPKLESMLLKDKIKKDKLIFLGSCN